MKKLKELLKRAKRFVRSVAAPAVAGIAFSVCALNASAQVSSLNLLVVTNQPAIVTTTATSNILSWVQVFNGSGIAVSWRFNHSGSSTSNSIVNFYTSVDGTNVSTVALGQLIAPANGQTDVIVNTNFDANRLAGYRWLIVGNIANTTGLTTLTNKGIQLRRTP